MADVALWGTETIINTISYTSEESPRYNHLLPEIVALATGGFVNYWQTFRYVFAQDQIHYVIRATNYYRYMDADGLPITARLKVDNSGFLSFPHLYTPLANGGLATVYSMKDAEGAETGPNVLRIYDPSGGLVRAPINFTTPEGHQVLVRGLATLANGYFIVEFSDHDYATGTYVNRFEIFHPNGTVAVPMTVMPALTGLTWSVGALKDGGFVVGESRDARTPRCQIFDADGSARGGPFLLASSPPDWPISVLGPVIDGLANGDFAAVWYSQDLYLGLHIYARVFHPDGTPLGQSFIADDFGGLAAAAGQEFDSAALPDGRFVVVWEDNRVDHPYTGGFWDIHGQIFNPDGTRSGSAFLVNTDSAADHLDTFFSNKDPHVAVLADGRFVVEWHLETGEYLGEPRNSPFLYISSNKEQIFDPRTTAVNLAGTELADNWIGSGFDDTLNGGTGNDSIAGGLGQDSIIGGDGADLLDGDDGADLLDSGAGNDRVFGGNGSDSARLGTGNDIYTDVAQPGIVGRDIVHGGVGADTIFGGGGNDTLFGDFGNDLLYGGNGDDLLYGGAGNDQLFGGAGNDVLTGGTDADTFVFNAPSGKDVITDFSTTEDFLSLSSGLWSGTKSASQILAEFGEVTLTGVVLTFSAGDTITLLGIQSIADLIGSIVVF